MTRLLLTLMLLSSLLHADLYPKLFEQLGTPLYKADRVFIKFYKLEPTTRKKVKYYHLKVQKLLLLAKKIEEDPTENKKDRQKYFKGLRDLQKDYDEITRTINAYLFKSIDANNYKEFTELMHLAHDIFLDNHIIKKRAMAYYVEHRTRGKIPALDTSYLTLSSDPELYDYVKGHLPRTHLITQTYSSGAVAHKVLLSKDEKSAFVGYGNHCFKSVDIQDFESSSEIASFDFNSQGCALVDISASATGEYLYLSDLKNGFTILDVSEASAPIQKDEYTQVNAMATVYAENSYTSFIIRQTGALSILDTSDKDNFKLLANYTRGNPINHIALDEERSRLYIADAQGLSVLDVSTLGNPREVYNLPIEDGANHVVLSPDKKIAYLASGDNGIHVLDISKDLEVSPISTCLTPRYAYHLLLSKNGEKLFVSALNDGIYYINTKDPKDLKHISTYKLEQPKASALSTVLNALQDTLFIAYGKAGIAKISLKE